MSELDPSETGPDGDQSARRVPSLDEVDPAVLHQSPDERAAAGVTDDEVRDAFLAVATEGGAAAKDLRGATLPALELDRLTLAGVDGHPVDLRNATVEAIDATHSRIELPVRLDGATVGECRLDEARFHATLTCSETTFTGPVSAVETRFDEELSFDDATFEGAVDFDEVVCRDDCSLAGATFEGPLSFRAGECHGDSNLLDDNTSFARARFADEADFRQTDFGAVHFEAAAFEDAARFREAVFTGDAAFADAAFAALAGFDEATFASDATFAEATVDGEARFRGATFEGGERALEADASFRDATFGDEVDFHYASFRGATFDGATFEARAHFEESSYDADADFPETTFADEVDFDDARFRGDADFSGVRFQGPSVFRGAEFSGGANFLEADVSFAEARFDEDADFTRAEIGSADFRETAVAGRVDFSEAALDDVDFEFAPVTADAFVDCTNASLRGGRIVQPAEAWIRFDMTRASVGDVELAAATREDYRQLLDYFRFCLTDFDEFDGREFDFGAHRGYLDRNAWRIHTFDDPPDADPDYAVDMTPEVAETTYLKAKQCASSVGDMKVAGEFRVKRQQYSRSKNLSVVRDGDAGVVTRVKNFGRAAENYFLGITCGHGMRPIRIGLAFALAPMFFAFPYAFGGSLFSLDADGHQVGSVAELLTAEGLSTFYTNVHFSYISYTTIGYGNIGPEGPLARLLAGSEAYLSTILAALLVYALVKRSEL